MRARPAGPRHAVARAVTLIVVLVVTLVVAPGSAVVLAPAHADDAPDPNGSSVEARGAGSVVRGRFNPVNPVVVRNAARAALPGRIRAGVSATVQITDGFGVPAVEVGAVVIEVSMVSEAKPGGLRVAAPGRVAGAPNAMVYEAYDHQQNQLVVPLDATGSIVFRASSTIAVGVTVVGWVDTTTTRSDVELVASPLRVLDTRSTQPVSPRRDAVVDLRSRAGLPTYARAVLANVTLTSPTGNGALEIRRAGTTPRDVPAMLVTKARNQSHLAVIPLDARGLTAFRTTSGTAHVIVDVVGWVGRSSGADVTGLAAPARQVRVVDTRQAPSAWPAGRTRRVLIAGAAGIPAGASSVTAVVTAVGGTKAGGVSLAPRTPVRGWTPLSVETLPGTNRSLVVTLPLGPTGAININRDPQVHLVVDVLAWTMPAPVAVRPADTSLLQPPVVAPPTDPPTDPPPSRLAEQRQLAAAILASSSRYALGTWWNDVLPGLMAVGLTYEPPPSRIAHRGFERSVKDDPMADPARRIANVCFGLATNLATGTWDAERIGVSREAGLRQLVRLIDYAVAGHLTQDARGWGTGKQGSLNAGYLGRAAWLVWDELSAPTRQGVAAMVAAEADDIAGRGVNYLRDRDGSFESMAGDSKSEEISWKALPVQLALAMLPDDDHRGIWSYTASRSALASWARPSDVSRSEVVQGLPIAAWLDGSNVEPDGIVRNHNRVAPDYMALVYQTLDQVWVQSVVGEPTPTAARTLVGPVLDAFTSVSFAPDTYAAPGGTIYTPDSAQVYYPEGVDWGTGMQLVYALMDTEAAAYSIGDAEHTASAESYSLLHLRAAVAMQDRYADGHTYADSTEFNYVGREELISQLAAQIVLSLHVQDAGLVSFTDASWSDF